MLPRSPAKLAAGMFISPVHIVDFDALLSLAINVPLRHHLKQFLLESPSGAVTDPDKAF